MIIFRFDPDSDCEVRQAATATTATIATNEADGPTSVATVATVAVAAPPRSKVEKPIPVLSESPAGASAVWPTTWWRVAILEPGGRTVEVDTPSGWTLAEWQAYVERYLGPGCAVTPIAG